MNLIKPSSLQIDTQSQLNAGLRSWWSANSVDTSKFVDSSNKLHGEWTAGSPIYSYCEKTKRHAVDFSNTEIQTASAERFYTFTMCCWVKINYAASDTFARIFEHGLNNSVTLSVNKAYTPNKFSFQELGTGNAGPISTTNISGDWQHVSIKYDGLTQYIYVNANLESTYARGSFVASSQVWHFGRNSGAASVTKLNGSIADVRYFNRAIPDGQIKSIYLNPAAPFERKQQTVGISTAQAFNPYWANQATQLAGTLQ